MSSKPIQTLILLTIIIALTAGKSYASDHTKQADITEAISNAVKPVIEKYDIPGMSVAVSAAGENYFYDYGVASKHTRQPVTSTTLFEIGSISKTFTATLACYAQQNGDLNLSDKAAKYLPSLKGSSFDHISLIDLGTHTHGGLPLQVPDQVQNPDDLMRYFKN